MRWILCASLTAILSGCAAVPAIPSIAGFAGAGGVTLYKKATETSPMKAEFVLIKVEIHHDTITQK